MAVSSEDFYISTERDLSQVYTWPFNTTLSFVSKLYFSSLSSLLANHEGAAAFIERERYDGRMQGNGIEGSEEDMTKGLLSVLDLHSVWGRIAKVLGRF